MRSLVLDELRNPDLERLQAHLGETLVASNLPDVWWLELPREQLTTLQAEHEKCGPHRLAVVLEGDSLKVELLVRSQASMRCHCIGYTDHAQRQWALEYLDQLIEELDLKT